MTWKPYPPPKGSRPRPPAQPSDGVVDGCTRPITERKLLQISQWCHDELARRCACRAEAPQAETLILVGCFMGAVETAMQAMVVHTLILGACTSFMAICSLRRWSRFFSRPTISRLAGQVWEEAKGFE